MTHDIHCQCEGCRRLTRIGNMLIVPLPDICVTLGCMCRTHITPECRPKDTKVIDMDNHIHKFDDQGLCPCGADMFPKGHKSIVEVVTGHDFWPSIDYLVNEYGLDRPNKPWGKGSPCDHIFTLVEAVKAHVPPRAYGKPPFTSHHIQAVKDRDALAFALRALVRAVDDEIKAERISPEADDAEPDFRHALEVGRELLTTCCPGCKGRYADTDKHTCTKEGS